MTQQPPGAAAAQRLVEGVETNDGGRLRMALRRDYAYVTSVLRSVGPSPAVTGILESGRGGALILHSALYDTSFHKLVADRAREQGHIDVVGASLPLIYESPEGDIGGAVVVGPPPRFVALVGRTAGDDAALVAALSVAKVHQLAVDPRHRGRGAGGLLARQSAEIFLGLGYLDVYGQFSVAAGLERFYERNGFTVLPEGGWFVPRALAAANVRQAIAGAPKERLFLRTTPNSPPSPPEPPPHVRRKKPRRGRGATH